MKFKCDRTCYINGVFYKQGDVSNHEVAPAHHSPTELPVNVTFVVKPGQTAKVKDSSQTLKTPPMEKSMGANPINSNVTDRPLPRVAPSVPLSVKPKA